MASSPAAWQRTTQGETVSRGSSGLLVLSDAAGTQ